MFSNKVYSFYLHKLSLPGEKDKPLQHVSLFVNLFSFMREYETILTSQLTKFPYLCYSLYQAVISICSFMWARQAFKAGIFGNPAQKVWKAIKKKKKQGRKEPFSHMKTAVILSILSFLVKPHLLFTHAITSIFCYHSHISTEMLPKLCDDIKLDKQCNCTKVISSKWHCCPQCS